jgi:hypothetical protein
MSFDGYIKGDYVIKTLIQKKKSNTLKIVFKDVQKHDKFVEMIEILYNGKKEIENNYNELELYQPRSTKILVTPTAKNMIYLNVMCDICNYEGSNISLSINCLKLAKNTLSIQDYYQDFFTISELIKDISNKRFIGLSLNHAIEPYIKNDNMKYKDTLINMFQTLEELLMDGFIMYSTYSVRSNLLNVFLQFYNNFKNIENIKVKSIINIIRYETKDKCPICLNNFCENECLILTRCKHVFHKNCILEMFEKSENDDFSKCPKCRTEHCLL